MFDNMTDEEKVDYIVNVIYKNMDTWDVTDLIHKICCEFYYRFESEKFLRAIAHGLKNEEDYRRDEMSRCKQVIDTFYKYYYDEE